MVTSTWETRERPILDAVLALEESIEAFAVNNERIVEATGLPPEVVGRALEALEEAGYLTGGDAGTLGDSSPQYFALRLLERGRREVGQWPPSVADAFLEKLDYMIATAADPDERSRLERLRDAAGEISKGVISGAIVAAGSSVL